MWPSDYARFKDAFVDDRICLFEAGVEWGEREDPIVILRRLMDLEQARKELTKGLILKMSIGSHGPDSIDGIEPHPETHARGRVPFFWSFATAAGAAPSFGSATTTVFIRRKCRSKNWRCCWAKEESSSQGAKVSLTRPLAACPAGEGVLRLEFREKTYRFPH